MEKTHGAPFVLDDARTGRGWGGQIKGWIAAQRKTMGGLTRVLRILPTDTTVEIKLTKRCTDVNGDQQMGG